MPSSFTDLGVPADLAESLATLGFSHPYPIQEATLADALGGHDVCAQAPTGSGKTLAFGIPLMAQLERAQSRRPRALVLAPTRELAAQIANQLASIGERRGRTVATFYGGVGFGKQLDALRSGVDVAVACPGRLIDLLDQRALKLSDVDFVVIDEADRMADMGFLPGVRRILGEVNPRHQTLLFSATLQGDVHRLITEYQRSPRHHVLDAPEDARGTRSHHFWNVERTERVGLTAGIVTAHGSTIVFCRTKHGADRLAKQLSQAGVDAVTIHGDRSQSQRDRALALFQEGRAQVLVGTDVAARGIHVDDVACVVHFDPPEDDATYVHRSGRTGRAGSDGTVISFIGADQVGDAKKLQRQLGLPLGTIEAPTDLPTPAPRPKAARLPAESPTRGRVGAWQGGRSNSRRSSSSSAKPRPGLPRRENAARSTSATSSSGRPSSGSSRNAAGSDAGGSNRNRRGKGPRRAA